MTTAITLIVIGAVLLLPFALLFLCQVIDTFMTICSNNYCKDDVIFGLTVVSATALGSLLLVIGINKLP